MHSEANYHSVLAEQKMTLGRKGSLQHIVLAHRWEREIKFVDVCQGKSNSCYFAHFLDAVAHIVLKEIMRESSEILMGTVFS